MPGIRRRLLFLVSSSPSLRLSLPFPSLVSDLQCFGKTEAQRSARFRLDSQGCLWWKPSSTNAFKAQLRRLSLGKDSRERGAKRYKRGRKRTDNYFPHQTKYLLFFQTIFQLNSKPIQLKVKDVLHFHLARRFSLCSIFSCSCTSR